MPPATRKGDSASGHACFPATSSISASPTVYVDGIPVVRKGDAYALHGCGKCPPHPRALAAGSPTVFVEGKPVGRIGDGISCGGSVAAGSSTVFVDDN